LTIYGGNERLFCSRSARFDDAGESAYDNAEVRLRVASDADTPYASIAVDEVSEIEAPEEEIDGDGETPPMPPEGQPPETPPNVLRIGKPG